MFQRTIHHQLVETLISNNFRDKPVDMNVLRLHMQVTYKDIYSDDWKIVEDIHSRRASVVSEDMESVTRVLTGFIKNRILMKGVDSFVRGDQNNADHWFTRGRSLNITPNPFIDPLQDGVIERLKEKDLPTGGKVIKSSFGIINSSLQYKGYKNGDLIMVVMMPKCGKSTFMVQEAVHAADQGFKVAHMFFGDFSEFDGLCIFMSCNSGQLIGDVVGSPFHYRKKCESSLGNWRVAAFPAFALDCEEVVAYAKNLRRNFPFDLLIIDYDSNVKPPKDAGMYESGGTMYSTFKGFGQSEGPVIMIGSQPKIQYWGQEVLGYGCAAESSRKQHVVDIMVTGGRNDKYKNIGTINLPLVRRGESAVMQKVKFDDYYSRILEISPGEYENLLRQHVAGHQKDSKEENKDKPDIKLDTVEFKNASES